MADKQWYPNEWPIPRAQEERPEVRDLLASYTEEQRHHRQKVLELQRECARKCGTWQFFPEDGYCVRCGRDITQLITLEEAAKSLITDCPYPCDRLFCD